MTPSQRQTAEGLSRNPSVAIALSQALFMGVPLATVDETYPGVLAVLHGRGDIAWDRYPHYDEPTRAAFFTEAAPSLAAPPPAAPGDAPPPPAAEPPANTPDWSTLIADAPRRGWYAWCQSRGIDPDEFRQRRDAAEAA